MEDKNIIKENVSAISAFFFTGFFAYPPPIPPANHARSAYPSIHAATPHLAISPIASPPRLPQAPPPSSQHPSPPRATASLRPRPRRRAAGSRVPRHKAWWRHPSSSSRLARQRSEGRWRRSSIWRWRSSIRHRRRSIRQQRSSICRRLRSIRQRRRNWPNPTAGQPAEARPFAGGEGGCAATFNRTGCGCRDARRLPPDTPPASVGASKLDAAGSCRDSISPSGPPSAPGQRAPPASLALRGSPVPGRLLLRTGEDFFNLWVRFWGFGDFHYAISFWP